MYKLFRIAASAVLLSAMLSVSGCSTSSRWFGYESYDMAQPADAIGMSSGGNEKAVQKNTDTRKVITEANCSIEVKDTEESLAKLTDIAKKYKGYILYSSLYSLQMKVEAASLKDAIADIERLGKIRNKYIAGTDVTDDFYDLKTRIDSASAVRDRYLELLKKAENVEAALKVEKELERVNVELELLKGRQQRLSNQIDYSSITVNVFPGKNEIPGPLGLVFKGLYKVIECLFVIKL